MTPEQWEGLLRRLNDGGCPVQRDHGYKIRPVGLAIEKIPGISCSSIFDLECGGTGYMLELLLRNELDRAIYIHGFQIQTPWGYPKLSLVPRPRKSSKRYPYYSFPQPGPVYDGDYVLNPFFSGRRSGLNPAEEIEGLLLAVDRESIPDEYPNLARIVVTLRVFDTRRNTFSAQFRLPADRRGRRVRERACQTTVTGVPQASSDVACGIRGLSGLNSTSSRTCTNPDKMLVPSLAGSSFSKR